MGYKGNFVYGQLNCEHFYSSIRPFINISTITHFHVAFFLQPEKNSKSSKHTKNKPK